MCVCVCVCVCVCCLNLCWCIHYILFVKLRITFSVSMYIICVTFVQRFKPWGKRFTNSHPHYYMKQVTCCLETSEGIPYRPLSAPSLGENVTVINCHRCRCGVLRHEPRLPHPHPHPSLLSLFPTRTNLSLVGAATSIIFVACLSRQEYACRDKKIVATKMFCFVAKNTEQTQFCRILSCVLSCFVATNTCTCLSRHKFCRDKNDTCGSSRQ